MTAICGLWNRDARPGAAAAVARMGRALAVYGAFRSARWDGETIALGIQLANLVPEDLFDRQPLSGGGGRFHLVADVRLDNRPELVAALGLGERHTRMADADIVLAAWERWEGGALDRLCGDFAIAVWDASLRRLHLARDMMGYRPLFYHVTGARVAFATMAKGLHALADVEIAPDPEWLRDYLALLPHRGEGSFFAGIKRIEPGQHITIHESGRIDKAAWYDWDRPTGPYFSNDRAYVDAFRETFDRAVNDRLRTSGAVASQLSGGMDSTAVTATAARILEGRGERLTAYTHVPLAGARLDCPEGRTVDEWALASRVAERHANIDHLAVDAPERWIGDDIDSHFHAHEYPALNLCNQVWMSEIGRQMRHRREAVMLVGIMGNMTISRTGIERLPMLVRDGAWLTFLREALALRRELSIRSIAAQTLSRLIPIGALHRLQRWRGRTTWTLGDYSALRAELASGPAFREHLAAMGHDPRFPQVRDLREKTVAELRRTDLMGLMNKGQIALYGIDQRDPTADRRLIELALALPARLLLRDGQTRWIYHAAFGDRVPEPVRRQPGKGLQGADWPTRLDRSRDLVAEELARATGTATALIDIPSLTKLNAERGLDLVISDRQRMAQRLKLLRGASVAHFVRKATRRNE